jgi:hypothetical protein
LVRSGAAGSLAPVTEPLPSGFDLATGRRKAFTEIDRRSGRLLNGISRAQIAGAENLLTKAIRARASGDAQRAEQLIERAARMPYDEREEGFPGVLAASMLVYVAISDQFEGSEQDDPTWLDVVLTVHPGLDPTGQAKVASVVHGFVLQKALFAVTRAEKRRIQQAFGDAPLEAELGDLPDSPVEQRQDIIRSLTAAAASLGDAYAADAERRGR